jgi:hypothetical protein
MRSLSRSSPLHGDSRLGTGPLRVENTPGTGLLCSCETFADCIVHVGREARTALNRPSSLLKSPNSMSHPLDCGRVQVATCTFVIAPYLVFAGLPRTASR